MHLRLVISPEKGVEKSTHLNDQDIKMFKKYAINHHIDSYKEIALLSPLSTMPFINLSPVMRVTSYS